MDKFTSLLFGFVLLCSACQKNACSDSVKATFHDATGTDGCGMVIKLKNGEFIEPKNLGDFNIEAQHGEKIWVSYHLAQNGGTVCMIGDLVIVDCITRR